MDDPVNSSHLSPPIFLTTVKPPVSELFNNLGLLVGLLLLCKCRLSLLNHHFDLYKQLWPSSYSSSCTTPSPFQQTAVIAVVVGVTQMIQTLGKLSLHAAANPAKSCPPIAPLLLAFESALRHDAYSK